MGPKVSGGALPTEGAVGHVDIMRIPGASVADVGSTRLGDPDTVAPI